MGHQQREGKQGLFNLISELADLHRSRVADSVHRFF